LRGSRLRLAPKAALRADGGLNLEQQLKSLNSSEPILTRRSLAIFQSCD